MKPDRRTIAEPNWKEMCEKLKEENYFLKEKIEIMDMDFQKRINALEKEKQFLLGQIEAFKYCAKGGAE